MPQKNIAERFRVGNNNIQSKLKTFWIQFGIAVKFFRFHVRNIT